MADTEMEKSLEGELDQGGGVKFTLKDVEYELPATMPVHVMLRLYMSASDSGQMDDMRWVVLNFSSRAEDVVCWLTKLTAEQLRELPAEEYDRVTDAVAEQIGKELADARPFSPNQQALAIIRRVAKMATAMGSGGGEPASSSKITAVGPGKQ